MNHGARILVVGRDRMLLQTRQLILGAYFQAEAAGRIQEAAAMIASRHFDLVVLCFTLSADECKQAVDMVKHQDPRPRILLLHTVADGLHRANADQDFLRERGPYALLKKVAEMLGVDLKQRVKKRTDPALSTARVSRTARSIES